MFYGPLIGTVISWSIIERPKEKWLVKKRPR